MPAAFLDRDGVINVDQGYAHRIDQFEFIPGALSACRRLHEAGYLLIVVTNQAGIAHGYYDERAYQELTAWMRQRFVEAAAPLTAVYHCPHHPRGKLAAFRADCDCRKPAPGMLLQAIREHQIDVSRSFLVGDKETDLEAARRAGVAERYLVRAAPLAADAQAPRAAALDDCLVVYDSLEEVVSRRFDGPVVKTPQGPKPPSG
jgi:D-glycero-D-manno-heptose 1,7-bisphosphate phosphatase